MFTGIIEEVGRVERVVSASGGSTVEIAATKALEGAHDGDSIACDGACLTITSRTPLKFTADCSAETLRRTTLGAWQPGMPVNLERALALGERLGGHLVQGHVEGVGRLLARRPEGESQMLRFGFPPELARYLVVKGSVAVSGVSLTVASLDEASFEIAVIPATLARTTLGSMAVGAPVNLETDMIAKYVERLLGAAAAPPASLSVEALKEMGYQ